MAGPRLTALQRQFDELRTGITTIERAATSVNRDLTEAETAVSTGCSSVQRPSGQTSRPRPHVSRA